MKAALVGASMERIPVVAWVSVLGLSLTAGALACNSSPEAPSSEGSNQPWVGTIETEGDVTTVVSESGSAWGGTGRLVEELSIGVEQGEEPYMFGRVISLAASDGRVYVADYQVPVIRVFDAEGRYLRDIGRAGEGPGEYEEPSAVSVLPDGRVLVRDHSPGQRTNVFGSLAPANRGEDESASE